VGGVLSLRGRGFRFEAVLECVHGADLQGRGVGQEDVASLTLTRLLDQDPFGARLDRIFGVPQDDTAPACVREVGADVAVHHPYVRGLDDVREAALFQLVDVGAVHRVGTARQPDDDSGSGNARSQDTTHTNSHSGRLYLKSM